MRIEINNALVTVYEGDALHTLQTLESDSVDCVVTSPPYWGLRDYGHADQIGLEPSPLKFIEKLAAVFDEVKRVLKPSGTCWLVIGDSYAGSGKGNGGANQASRKQTTNSGSYHGGLVTNFRSDGIKPKDLCGIPWRLAFALQDRGWYLRQDIIWAKPAPMPESVTDRCTRSHEYIFLLTKSGKYFYDGAGIAEPVADDEKVEFRNCRDVWTIQAEPYTNRPQIARRVRVGRDEPCDGRKRTTSADCPAHGDRSGSVATARHDERTSYSLFDNKHSGTRPAPEQEGGCDPIETRPAVESAQRSSDLQGQPHSGSAKLRSNQSRRTGHAPETSPAYNASAQSSPHTLDKSELREPYDSVERKHESNSVTGESGGDSRGADTSESNAGKSELESCVCEYYIEVTGEASHFATFPTALVEMCIKAGCPQDGVVMDPFGGCGTTSEVALKLGRRALTIELNPEYVEMIRRNLGLFAVAG